MRAIITPSGEKVVSVEWPNGQGFVLERDEALGFAFTMLATVRNLFSSVDELNAAVLAIQNGFMADRAERQSVQ